MVKDKIVGTDRRVPEITGLKVIPDYGLAIRLKGGADAARKLCASTRVFLQATSIGGVESLIEHRKPIEGPSSPTPDDLVRLSCGIEAAEDLIDDLVVVLDHL